MTSFESLIDDFDWEEIPNCPGRYRLKGGRVPSHPLDLAGPEAEAISGSSDQCRDRFLLVPLPGGGGLLSYLGADGSYLHTLNTPAGLERKLRDLGVILDEATLRSV